MREKSTQSLLIEKMSKEGENIYGEKRNKRVV